MMALTLPASFLVVLNAPHLLAICLPPGNDGIASAVMASLGMVIKTGSLQDLHHPVRLVGVGGFHHHAHLLLSGSGQRAAELFQGLFRNTYE